MINQDKKFLKNNRGQSLVEFVLLFAIVFFISRFFLVTTSKGIEKEWKAAIKLIISPNGEGLQFR
tara:strand:- start:395 stop:589 length:195 start_codon:yes stop_codon:yes gene_type:complete